MYVSWDNILLKCWLIVVVVFFKTFYDLFLLCESFSKHDDFVRGKIEDERKNMKVIPHDQPLPIKME